jgi:integrase
LSHSRLQMAFEDWPAVDQQSWNALFHDGDIFDGRGAALQWRDATRKTNLKHYARWLAWLDSENVLDRSAAPWSRATPQRIAAYAHHEIERVSQVTVSSSLIGLKCVLIKMNPDLDWDWLRQITNRLKIWAKPTRERRDRLLPANEMMATVLTELHQLGVSGGKSRHTDLAFRDVLTIGILISSPIRLKNLTSVCIGQQLQRVGDEWHLSFPSPETKNYQDLTYILPQSLEPALAHYLSTIRPRLPGAGNTTALLISQKGNPLAYQSIYSRVILETERMYGVDINPHSFRTIVATWLAEHSARAALFARPLLGHRNPATTERHYIRASKIEASRRVSDAIIQLRDQQPT